jgi:N4 Gp49/Sf6 Gp66 family protein
MSLQETDAASAAVQKTPNRIPLAYIESQILAEQWIDVPGMQHVTLLGVTLKNGFVVFGKSVPADPENFDAELGKRFAREDAIRQCWPLFAFALRCDLEGISVEEDLKALR